MSFAFWLRLLKDWNVADLKNNEDLQNKRKFSCQR